MSVEIHPHIAVRKVSLFLITGLIDGNKMTSPLQLRI